MPYCVLGPEMVLGQPLSPAPRKVTDINSSGETRCQKWKTVIPPRLGSVLSGLKYNSIKSSVKRAASVRVKRRERKIVRAQDIFAHETVLPGPEVQHKTNHSSHGSLGSIRPGSIAPRHGRSTTARSAPDLNKSLPEVPDEPFHEEADVSVREFEGYLDMLGYLQRDLPAKPKGEQFSTPSQPQVVIKPLVKEEEWLSSRSHSRQSTAYTRSDDELSRLRSQSGSGRRLESASASRKTVTPMSSMSEGELCGFSNITSHPTPVVTSRIEEVSEPATSPEKLTPKRRSTTTPPLICYHCDRIQLGRDLKDLCGSPQTVVQIPKSQGSSDTDDRDANWASGPTIAVKDDEGRRYILYTNSSRYRALDEAGPDSDFLEAEERNDSFEFSSPFTRPSNPDPYAADDSPSYELPEHDNQHYNREETDIGANLENLAPPSRPTPTPPTSGRGSLPHKQDRNSPTDPESPLSRRSRGRAQGEQESEIELEPSFWKDPQGVIMVYHGIELDGSEVYFGNDISYLGSFYDDDEGSSGLGSTRNSTSNSTVDLVGAGSGLAVIPEGGSSDDLWDDEVFEATDCRCKK